MNKGLVNRCITNLTCDCSVSQYPLVLSDEALTSDQTVSGGCSVAPAHQGMLSSYWLSSMAVGGTWGVRLSESRQAQNWRQQMDSS